MDKKTRQLIDSGELTVPVIKEWVKTKWIINKKITNWVLVDCADWAFTWIILSKEVKELERSGYDLAPGRDVEAEIVNTNIRHEDWHFIVSITKLLQYDVRKSILAKFAADEIITVVPTEANLWWLLIDMHWIKWFIPLSQLAPIHYPRVEDWDQEAIFEKLLSLIWQEIKVRIINIDEDEKRVIMSEREALKEEREKILSELAVGKIFEWVISGLSSYWLFVTIGGTVEWLVHISEITYGHVNSIDKLWKVWTPITVKVIWLDNGKISLSSKKLRWDPWTELPKSHKTWDIIEGEVIRFVPYWVFVRVFQDINWLVHLSELSQKSIQNPLEVVKLGQIVKVKIILLDYINRKIWLSMKGLLPWDEEISTATVETRPYKKPYVAEKTVAKEIEVKEEEKEEKKEVKETKVAKEKEEDSAKTEGEYKPRKRVIIKKTTKKEE